MSNKMRSFLTMLGIIIGVTALVVLVSLVNGTTDSILGEVEALGSDMLSVSIIDDKSMPLKLEDIEQMQTLDQIDQISPACSFNTTAKYLSSDANVTMYGVTPAYYDIQSLELEAGRFLKTADIENRTYVAVLSHDAAEELFGSTDVLGMDFSIDGRYFQVVGVLKESDSILSTMIIENAIYTPFTVAGRMNGQPYVTTFYATATQDTYSAENAVNQVLLSRFRQDDDAFRIMNMSSISEAMDMITGMLSTLLGSIAAISLLVGGIGIMNIMLVSVTERTREIGIRKAIGAGHRSIMAQFLVEALLVSLMGCILGLVLSWIILSVATSMGSIIFTMQPDVVALAVGFSSFVGLVFGIYPARKAAKKHPIEALRYEG